MSKLIRILIVLIMALSLPMATAIVLNGYNDHGKYKGLADSFKKYHWRTHIALSATDKQNMYSKESFILR